MDELDSLIKRLQSHHPLPPGDQDKQARQAMLSLQNGLLNLDSNNEQASQIQDQLGRMLQPGAPLALGDLQRLQADLQRFAAEAARRFTQQEDKPLLTNVDPSRLPPAYRGRIQKYFEKLSEK
jgi:hypothetical protein